MCFGGVSMFAEQEMLGQATIVMDSKKRIILPPFTYREEGDTLVVIVDNKENLVELMEFNQLYQKYQMIRKEGNLTYLKKYYLADFSKRVVDAHNRITLPASSLSILKEPTVFVRAMFDRVFLFSNQEEYCSHFQNIKSFEGFPYR